MKTILPNKITIEPEDAYIAVLRFLDKHNEKLQSDELRSLVGEMIQVGIAQSTYRLWLETFREVLIESGALKDTHTFTTILPDKVTLSPRDPYVAIVRFLDKYNENLQATELKNLVSELTLVDNTQSTYRLWLEIFREALLESGTLKETD